MSRSRSPVCALPLLILLLVSCAAARGTEDLTLRMAVPISSTYEASYVGDATFDEDLDMSGLELAMGAGAAEGAERSTWSTEFLLGLHRADDLSVFDMGFGGRLHMSEEAQVSPFLAGHLVVSLIEDDGPPPYDVNNMGQTALRFGVGVEAALDDGWFVDLVLDTTVALKTMDGLIDFSGGLFGGNDVERELEGPALRIGFGRRF